MTRMFRQLSVVAAALVVLAFGSGYAILSAADHDPRYAQVVSIAEAPAYQDAALVDRAWALPVAALYRDRFEYQSNPSFCGPTSAANVVNSLGLETNQREVLAGTSIRPFLGLIPGLTLDQEAEVVRTATGKPVDVLRDLSLTQFREHLRQSNNPQFRYVVNFNRAPLWGAGHGHISPILGYLEEEDLVFVGDVNEQYRPFLVSPERLLAAMHTIDSATGLNRGLLRVTVGAGSASQSAVQ